MTALIDGLRATINEGASLASMGSNLAILAVWGVGCLAVGIRLFRWQ